VTGCERAARGGTFFEPTVLTDVTTDMVVSKEKTFGPVAPLHRFKTDAEAIEMANEAPARGGGKQGAAPICRSATSAASGVSPRRWNTGIVGTDEGIIPDAKA
jgi:succinate-semialdehyde dehydrogenase/glutarate-semialdehyde dehydrogenase